MDNLRAKPKRVENHRQVDAEALPILADAVRPTRNVEGNDPVRARLSRISPTDNRHLVAVFVSDARFFINAGVILKRACNQHTDSRHQCYQASLGLRRNNVGNALTGFAVPEWG